MTITRSTRTLRFSGYVETPEPPATSVYVSDFGAGASIYDVSRITSFPVVPLNLGVVYDLVVVARIMHQSAPCDLIEIDPIPWKTLQYADVLSDTQTLSATCKVSSLPESVVQYIRSPDFRPCELRLTRNGKVVFAGPLLGWQRSDDDLTLKAEGILSYTKYMTISAYDFIFKQQDQLLTAKLMIDQWQNQGYGNFGIDTSGIGSSGVLRDSTYMTAEMNVVFTVLQAMGKLDGGFDIDVDPETRALELWFPQKGVDRSQGEDAIIFDDNSITSNDIVLSVAPGDLAATAIGTASPPNLPTLYETVINTELVFANGLTTVTRSYQDIGTQADLERALLGVVYARSSALIIPGPKLRVTENTDLANYAVGDTVLYDTDDELGVNGIFRASSRTVNVDENGVESVDLTLTTDLNSEVSSD